MRMLSRLTCLLGLLAAGLGLSACPKPPADPDGPGIDSASFEPAAPINQEDPLGKAAGLWLGMSTVELSQVYNAPEGHGDGFTRVLDRNGDVITQTITFDKVEGQPLRLIVAMLYRDKLYWMVDRRSTLTAEQAEAWFAECQQAYGAEPQATLPTSQWIWGDPQGINATFTRDNASPQSMAATLILIHQPTYLAAHSYLMALQERQAQQEPGQP